MATQKYSNPIDVWIRDGGYHRNLFLEEHLPKEVQRLTDEANRKYGYPPYVSTLHPVLTPTPSWWIRGSDYGGNIISHQKAIDYLELALKVMQAKKRNWDYLCSSYPRDTVFCQHSAHNANTGAILQILLVVQKRVRDEKIEEEKIQADIMKTQLFEKKKQELIEKKKQELTEKEDKEKAWIAKRNKTLLLIASLFLFG